MAGLFGGKASMMGDDGGGELTLRDRAMAAMAALNGDMATAMRIRQAPGIRAHQKAALDAITARLDPTYQDGPPVQVSQPAGLFGGQAADLNTVPTPDALQPPAEAPQAPGQYQLPQRTSDPLSMNSPDLAKLAMQAQVAGVPISSLLEVLKGQQPHITFAPNGEAINDKSAVNVGRVFPNRTNVNGTIADLNDPNNTNRVISEAPVKGAMPVYDNLGHVTDWRLPPGVVEALGRSSEASQRGQTMGTVYNKPYRDGTTAPTLGRDMFAAGAGGPGGAGEPGAGRTQSPADRAYSEEGAKTAAAQYKGIADAGAQANAKIAGFKQIDRLLGNFEGGKLAPMGLDIASAANSIGFKMDPKMQNAQAADAISKQLVLSLSGGSLGTGFSNADRTFMEAQAPGLLQSAGGRRQIVSIGIATAQRQQDVAAKARQWQDRFGRIDAADGTGKHFQDYLDAWAEAHPCSRRADELRGVRRAGGPAPRGRSQPRSARHGAGIHGDQRAVSPKGARGLMQLMPGTAGTWASTPPTPTTTSGAAFPTSSSSSTASRTRGWRWPPTTPAPLGWRRPAVFRTSPKPGTTWGRSWATRPAARTSSVWTRPPHPQRGPQEPISSPTLRILPANLPPPL
jgi:hypothetical protein